MNDDLSVMSSPDSGEHNEHIVNSTVLSNLEMLAEYEDDAKSIELQPEILEYIDYNPTLTFNSEYNPDAHLFSSYFLNVDFESIVDIPHNIDPQDDSADEKTNKFFEVKSYFENMNYWDENEEDVWHDSLSYEGPTIDTKDHLDTKVNRPTKVSKV